MKTKLPLLLRKALMATFAALTFASGTIAHATDPFIGNIVFVGDSITNGSVAGVSPASGGSMPSWRYDAWKHLLDSGYTDRTLGNTTATANQNLVLGAKDFQMVGSVNKYAGSDAVLDALATNYAGSAFYNIHEGHNGWRARGMVGTVARTDTIGSGYIRNWISSTGVNGGTRLDSTAAGTAWNNTVGDANYWGKNIMNPPSTFAPNTYSPDTVVIAIGTNDITAGYSAASIVADIKTMIDMYRESNANATFYVTYVWERQTHVAAIDNVNNLLAAVGTTWNTGTSTVNIFDGFVGYNATTMNYDNLHPGDQGGLIFASNLARAMGIGQRTAAQTRAAASSVGFNHTSMTASSGGWTTASQLVASSTVHYLDIQSARGSTGRTMSVGTGQLSATTNFTFEVSLQMYANVSNNICSINIGNGNGLNGQLDIYGSEIRWMGTNATYTASSPATGFVLYSGINLTSGTNDFRIDWIQADATNGLLSGYYIWYNGVLIGEAMQGSAANNVSGVANGITIGGLTATRNTYAAIQDIALNTSSSLAPLAEGTTYGALVLTPVVAPPSSYTLNNQAFANGNIISSLVGYLPTNPDATLEVEMTGTATANVTAALALYGLKATDTDVTNNLAAAIFTFTGDLVVTRTAAHFYYAAAGAGSGLSADVTTIFNGAVKGAGAAGLVGSIFGGAMSSATLVGNTRLEFHNANTYLYEGTTTNSTYGIIYAGNYNGQLTGSTHLIISAGRYGGSISDATLSYIYGGGCNTGGTTTGSTLIDIRGGAFLSGVAAGGYLANVATTAGNSTTLNITGGTFTCDVYGGGYSGHVGAAGVLSNTNINISGGLYNLSMSQGIYGGSVTSGIVYGRTNININGFAVYDDAITFGISGNIYGGSKGTGAVNGGSNITLQDFSAYSLSKITSSLISGNGATTAVTGTKTLNLINVTGTLTSNIANFTSLIVSGNSHVDLSGSASNVAAMSVSGGSSLFLTGTVSNLNSISVAANSSLTLDGGTLHFNTGAVGKTLNVTGNLTATDGSIFEMLMISGTNTWDTIAITGDFNGSGELYFRLSATNTLANAQYTLLTTTGSLNLDVDTQLNIIGALASGNDATRQDFTLHTTSNSIYMNVVGDSATLTWTGAGNNIWMLLGGDPDTKLDANWNTPDSTDTRFHISDSVIFGNQATAQTVTLSGVLNPTDVSVTGGTYTFISDGTGKISGTATTLSVTGGTLTLNLSNDFGGTTTIGAGGTLVLGNANAMGTGSITFAGGTLGVNTSMTLAGTIAVSSGSANIVLSNAARLTLEASANNLATVLTGNGTLALSVAANVTGTKSIGAGTTLELTTAATRTVDTMISGAGTLALKGAFTWSLNKQALNNFTGTVDVAAGARLDILNTNVTGQTGNGTFNGTIKLGAGSTLWLWISGVNPNTLLGANATAIFDGGILVGSAVNGNNVKFNIEVAQGGLIFNNGGSSYSQIFSGNISSSAGATGNITRNAGSTEGWTFTGDQSGFNGKWIYDLDASNLTKSIFQFGNGGVAITDGGVFKANSVAGTGEITTTGIKQFLVTFNFSTDFTIGNLISLGMKVQKDGAGIMTITAANTYTQGTTINAGGIKLAGLGTLGMGAISIASGTFLENAKLLGTTTTFSAVISGAGQLRQTGTGTTTLSGAAANTYSGGTSVSAGVLNAAKAGALGASSLTVTGGTVNISAAQATMLGTTISGGKVALSDTATLGTTRALSLSGTGTLSLGAAPGAALALTVGAFTLNSGTTIEMRAGTVATDSITMSSFIWAGGTTGTANLIIHANTGFGTAGQYLLFTSDAGWGTWDATDLNTYFVLGGDIFKIDPTSPVRQLFSLALGTDSGVGGTANQVYLLSSGSPETLDWAGLGDGSWTLLGGTGTKDTNWDDKGGALADSRFHTLDNVTFGSLASAGTRTISIKGDVNPGTITVSASGYVFNEDPTDSGKIIGMATTLTVANGGELTLNLANTYGGGTTIDAGGTLTANEIGALGTGALSVSGTAIISAAQSISGASIVSGGTLTANEIGALGTGALSVSGTAIINAAQSISGASIASGGVLTLNALGGLGTGAVSVAGTLELGYTGAYTNTTTGAGTLKILGGADISLTGNNSGYTGGWNLAANSSLTINSATALGTTGAITFGGGTLFYGAGINTDISTRIAVANSAPVSVNVGTSAVAWASGTWTGTAAQNLIVNGTTGALTLGWNAANVGPTNLTIQGGTVKLTQANSLRNSGTSISTIVTMQGGTLDLNGINSQTGYYGTASARFAAMFDNTLVFDLAANASASLINSQTAGLGTSQEKGFGFSNALAVWYKATNNSSGTATIIADITAFGTSGVAPREFKVEDSLNTNIELIISGQIGNSSGNEGTSVTLNKTGSGTLMITGANNTPGLTVSAGTLIANNVTGNALGTGIARTLANTVTIAAGATLDIWASSTASIIAGAGTITNSQTGTATNLTIGRGVANASTFTGIITGNMGITVNVAAASVVALSGANTFTGGTIITSGILRLTGAGTLSGTSGISIDSAGILDIQKASGATGNLTLSAVISGGGILRQSGTGVTTLTGINTYTGATQITAGTLLISGTGELTATSGIAITSGAFFEIAKTAGANGNLTLSAVISGAGILRQSGTGTTTLAGINTYTGATQITGGTLKLTGDGTLGSTSGIAISSGAFLEVAKDTNLTLTQVISGVGGGSLIKSGTGTLTLSGASANTYSGGTSVSAGVLNATKAGALGASTLAVTGGEVNISAAQANLGATSITGGSVVMSGTGTLGAGTVTVGGVGSLDLGGLALTNSIFYNAGGAITGYSNYTGTMTLGAGVNWGVSTATALKAGASVVVSNGAEFTLTGAATDDGLALFTLNNITNNGSIYFDLTNVVDFEADKNYTLLTATSGLAGITDFAGFSWNSLELNEFLAWSFRIDGGSLILDIFDSGHEVNITWGGTDGTWNTTRQNLAWTSGTPTAPDFFAHGDLVTFNGTGNTVTIEGAVRPATITVEAGDYIFNAGTDGEIAGAGTLSVTGGTLALNLLNSFSGGTTVGVGATLDANVAGALGTGALTVNGGNVNIADTQNISAAFLNGGVTSISVPGALGAGTVTFGGGTLNFTSSMTMSNALAVVASNAVSISLANSAVVNLGTTANNLTMNISGAGRVNLAGTTWTLEGIKTVNAGTTLGLDFGTLAGRVDAGLLVGAGDIYLTQASNATWRLSVTGAQTGLSGTLYIRTNLATGGGLAITNNANVFGTAKLDIHGSFFFTATGAILTNDIYIATGNSAVLNGTSGNNVTFSGKLTGGGLFTTIAGTATIAPSLTGDLTEFTGSFSSQLASGTATSLWTFGNLTSSGNIFGAGVRLLGNSAGGNSTVTYKFDYTNDVTLNATLGASGATAANVKLLLVKSGNNTLTVNQTNYLTGGITISAGTLKLTDLGTLGTGAITNTGILEIAKTNSIEFAQVISGVGGQLKQTGTGTTTLSGTNTYTGATTITAGKVIAASNAALGNGSAVTLGNVAGDSATLSLYKAGTKIELAIGAFTLYSGATIEMRAGSVATDSITMSSFAWAGGTTGTVNLSITANTGFGSTGQYLLFTSAAGWGTWDSTDLNNHFILSGDAIHTNVNSPLRQGFVLAFGDDSSVISGTAEQVYLLSSGGPGTLDWAGLGDGSWTLLGGMGTTDTNWDAGVLADSRFHTLDNVTFGSGALAGTRSVSIMGDVNPGTITVSDTGYIFNADGTGGKIVGATTTLTVASGGELTLNLSNTYGGGTTVAGTLNAMVANALGTGVLTVNGGVVNIAEAQSISSVTLSGGVTAISHGGALGAGTVTFGGGTLQIASDMTLANIFAQTAGSTALISVDSGKVFSFESSRTGAVTYTLSGAGTVRATVAGVFGTGAVYANSGRLEFALTANANYANSITTTAANLLFSGAGTFEYTASSALSLGTGGLTVASTAASNGVRVNSLTVTGPQTWDIATGKTFRISGTGNNSGAMTNVGTNDIKITGGGLAIVRTGAAITGVAGLSWVVEGGSTLAAIVAGADLGSSVTLNNGTLTGGVANGVGWTGVTGTYGTWSFLQSMALNIGIGGGTVSVFNDTSSSARTMSFAGSVSGTTGALTFNRTGSASSGAGSVTLSGTLSGLSGVVTVDGSHGTGTFSLIITSDSMYTGGTVLTSANSILNFGAHATSGLSYSGIISGSGRVIFNRSGQTITITGANSYDGTTAIQAGTVLLSGGGKLGDGLVTISNGAKLTADNGVSVASSINGSGATSYLNVLGTGAFTGALTGTYGVQATDTLRLNGVTGSAAITLNNNTTLNLVGNNTTGTLAVATSAVATLTGTGSISGAVTINGSSAALLITGTGVQTGNITVSAGGSLRAASAAAAKITVGANGTGAVAASGTLGAAGTGLLLVDGRLVLGGQTFDVASNVEFLKESIYEGGTKTINFSNNATLTLPSISLTSAIGSAAHLTLSGAGTLAVGTVRRAYNATGWGATTTLGAGSILKFTTSEIHVRHTQNDWNCRITGVGSVVMAGMGAMMLSNTGNDYSGGTTVTSGVLYANGAGTLGSGALAVSNRGEVIFTGSQSLTNLTLNSGILTFNAPTSLLAFSGDASFSGNNTVNLFDLDTTPFMSGFANMTFAASTEFTFNYYGTAVDPGTYSLFTATNLVGFQTEMINFMYKGRGQTVTVVNGVVSVSITGTPASTTLNWAGAGKVPLVWEVEGDPVPSGDTNPTPYTTPLWAPGTVPVVTDTRFYNGDAVTFDAITFSQHERIIISGHVAPASMVVDNSVLGNYTDYTFSGGSIVGAGSVTKLGRNVLSFWQANTFTGAMTVYAGTANAYVNGALGKGTLQLSGGVTNVYGNLTNSGVYFKGFEAQGTGATNPNSGRLIVYTTQDWSAPGFFYSYESGADRTMAQIEVLKDAKLTLDYNVLNTINFTKNGEGTIEFTMATQAAVGTNVFKGTNFSTDVSRNGNPRFRDDVRILNIQEGKVIINLTSVTQTTLTWNSALFYTKVEGSGTLLFNLTANPTASAGYSLAILGDNSAFSGRIEIVGTNTGTLAAVMFNDAASFGTGTIRLENMRFWINDMLANSTGGGTSVANPVLATLEIAGRVEMNGFSSDSSPYLSNNYFTSLRGDSNAFLTTWNATVNATTGEPRCHMYFTGDLTQFYGTLEGNGAAWMLGAGGDSFVNNQGHLFGLGTRITSLPTGTNITRLVVNYTNDAILNASMDGRVQLTKSGSGTLTLNRENTSTQTLTITDGTLRVVDIRDTAGVLIADNNGLGSGTIVQSAGTTLLIDRLLSDTTLTQALQGTGTIEKRGTKTLTLSGANTHTGYLNVIDGTVRVTGSMAFADIMLRESTTYNSSLQYGGGSRLVIERGANSSVASAIRGSGSVELNLSNGAIVTFSGANTYEGETIVSGNGTLKLAVTGDIGSAYGHLIVNAGATFDATAKTGSYNLGGVYMNGGTLRMADGAFNIHGSTAGSNYYLGEVKVAIGEPYTSLYTATADVFSLAGGSSIEFCFNANGSSDKLNTNSFIITGGGTVELIIHQHEGALAIGQHTLITANSGLDVGNFTFSPVPTYDWRMQYILGGSSTEIWLNVTEAGELRTWKGVAGDIWTAGNSGPLNWKEGDYKFLNSDGVVFDATTGGTVKISGAVVPSIIFVTGGTHTLKSESDTAADYLSGGGGFDISGGELHIDIANLMTGNSTISGGVVNVNVGDGLGQGDVFVRGGVLNAEARLGAGEIYISAGEMHLNGVANILDGDNTVYVTGTGKLYGHFAGAVGAGAFIYASNGGEVITNTAGTYTNAERVQIGEGGTYRFDLGEGKTSTWGADRNTVFVDRATLQVDSGKLIIGSTFNGGFSTGNLVVVSDKGGGGILELQKAFLFQGRMDEGISNVSVVTRTDGTLILNDATITGAANGILQGAVRADGGQIIVKQNNQFGMTNTDSITSLYLVNSLGATSATSGNLHFDENVTNEDMNASIYMAGGSITATEANFKLQLKGHNSSVMVYAHDRSTGPDGLELEYASRIAVNLGLWQQTTSFNVEQSSAISDDIDLVISGVLTREITTALFFNKYGAGHIALEGDSSTLDAGYTFNVYEGGITLRNGGNTGEAKYNLAANAALTLDAATGTSNAMAGVIVGAGSVTKTGAGEFTMSGNSLFTGGVIVEGGTLIAGNDKAFGTGKVDIGIGATLDLADYYIANDVYYSGGSSLEGYTNFSGNLYLQKDAVFTLDSTFGQGSTIFVDNSSTLDLANNAVGNTVVLQAATSKFTHYREFTGTLVIMDGFSIANGASLGVGASILHLGGDLALGTGGGLETITSSGGTISGGAEFNGILTIDKGIVTLLNALGSDPSVTTPPLINIVDKGVLVLAPDEESNPLHLDNNIRIINEGTLMGGSIAGSLTVSRESTLHLLSEFTVTSEGNAEINNYGTIIIGSDASHTGELRFESGMIVGGEVTTKYSGGPGSSIVLDGGVFDLTNNYTYSDVGLILGSTGGDVQLISGTIRNMKTVSGSTNVFDTEVIFGQWFVFDSTLGETAFDITGGVAGSVLAGQHATLTLRDTDLGGPGVTSTGIIGATDGGFMDATGATVGAGAGAYVTGGKLLLGNEDTGAAVQAFGTVTVESQPGIPATQPGTPAELIVGGAGISGTVNAGHSLDPNEAAAAVVIVADEGLSQAFKAGHVFVSEVSGVQTVKVDGLEFLHGTTLVTDKATNVEITGLLQGTGDGNSIEISGSNQHIGAKAGAGTIPVTCTGFVANAHLDNMNVDMANDATIENTWVTGGSAISGSGTFEKVYLDARNLATLPTVTGTGEGISGNATLLIDSSYFTPTITTLDLTYMFAGTLNITLDLWYSMDFIAGLAGNVDEGYRAEIVLFDYTTEGNLSLGAVTQPYNTYDDGWIAGYWGWKYDASQFATNGVIFYEYIPEPTTATLGMLGLASLLLRRRRRPAA